MKTKSICDQFVIENPKRRSASASGRGAWFPYYAGFSDAFARRVIQSARLEQGSAVLDPWNGSGTSTAAAAAAGHRAIGFDLNPVMAVAAKARVFPTIEMPSVVPLLSEIVAKAADTRACKDNDPLLKWFMPSAAAEIRSIEAAIRILLVSGDETGKSIKVTSGMSSIASFFYIALFRAVRHLMGRFQASNPTWVTRPASVRSRIRPNVAEIRTMFQSQVHTMTADIPAESRDSDLANTQCAIQVGSSENLPIPSNSVDFVLSSPPYCTRIDYGIATSPELAVLGLDLENELRELRSNLIGTPTIQERPHVPDPHWGTTCNAFLAQVSQHASKAAKSYYYKTFTQYFDAIARSMSEIGRCTRSGGNCVIVVQDSYFKGIRVDLAPMFTEIAFANRLTLSRQVDFPASQTIAHINTRSRNYRASCTPVESVLCFTKN